MTHTGARVSLFFLAPLGLLIVAGCGDPTGSGDKGLPRPLDPILVEQGKEIFRHETFGNEVFWTDTARMHEVIAISVSPALALAVGQTW